MILVVNAIPEADHLAAIAERIALLALWTLITARVL